MAGTYTEDDLPEDEIPGADAPGDDDDSNDSSATSEDVRPDWPPDEDVLKEAQSRLDLAEEAETDIRRAALDDLKFRSGEQWPEDIQQSRERDGRPCLVINRLPQFVNQVANDQRQNRPAIKVHSVGDGASEETARIIQGLVRHIEYNSNAEVAYDTAFENAAGNSFGYWRILTDFVHDKSFDQEIYIKRIRNPFSVFLDPYAQGPDGSDANWGFIVDDMSPDDYRAQYPDSKLASPESDWSAIGNQMPGWVEEKSARVVEYYCKVMQKKRIHLLSTGEVVRDEHLEARVALAAQSGLSATVVKTRIADFPIVYWYKINGIEILEKTVWPGSYIPIVPVYGGELWVDGKRILESVIRHAKDPQRMYNYWASAETETIALAPRTPFILAEGQAEGYGEEWGSANRRNHAYLPYKPVSLSGQMVPPPQRQSFEPAVQAITNARMVSADDLKATTGIYDSSVGAQSNEISGVAIQNRAGQSQISTFHFTDNLKRSLRHTGVIIIDLIPKIYDTARTARIIGDDGEQRIVKLNQPHHDESGKPVLYSMNAGRYDVVVDTGPSYASKRQEAAASILDFSRAVPQVAQSCADLIAKNMDWPGAQEIADRLKLLLPPALQTDPKKQQVPPQVQVQMQQMSAMIKKLSDELSETTKIIETKQLELQHKERVEAWNIQLQDKKISVDAEIAMAKLGTQGSIALLEQEIAGIKHQNEMMNQRLGLIGNNQPIQAPNDFNPQQADGGNYAGFGHVGSGPTGGQTPGQPMEGS